jgi:hypothetical protein
VGGGDQGGAVEVDHDSRFGADDDVARSRCGSVGGVEPVDLFVEVVADQVDQAGGAQRVPGVVDVEEQGGDAGRHDQVGHQDRRAGHGAAAHSVHLA